MKEFTVLILDDDKVMRESFIYYFEDQGWRVLAAETAEEALELMSHDRPDGAIVDIRLPGIDGQSFIYQTRNTYPQLAYVICTGSVEYHLPNEMAAIGNVSNMVFAKPVYNIKELEDELLRQIEASHASH